MSGIVPAVVITVFLGIFALYTAKLLIDFKLNHPGVHNMGELWSFYVGGGTFLHILQATPDISFLALLEGRCCRRAQSYLRYSAQ